MMLVALTKGKAATIDDQDYLLVAGYRWYAYWSGKTWYAMTNVRGADGKIHSLFMHRLLMAAPKTLQVDHRDGDGLNNCRSNLRLCTALDNQRNRHNAWGKSRFKGVTWNKRKGKWQAQISVQRRCVYLGLFEDEGEAAAAYDAAALSLFGEFAQTNAALGVS